MIWTRREFCESDEMRATHSSMVAGEAFRIGAAVSMLEYQRQISRSCQDDPVAAAYRLQGALQFLELFSNLANLPQGPIRRDHDNLLTTD